jgi:Tfp pilus assembly protein PilF
MKINPLKFGAFILIVISLGLFLEKCSKPAQKNVFEEGMSLEKSGKSKEALDKYAEVLLKNPNDARANLRMAIIHSSLNNLDKAEVHYRQTLKLDPKNLEAHLNYSGFLFKVKRYEPSLQELALVEKEAPQSPEAEIARSLMVRVDKAKIRNSLIKSLEADMSQKSPVKDTPVKLAKAYVEEGDELSSQHLVQEATSFYKKAVELTPNNAEYHYLFAQFYDQTNQKEDSVKELERANNLDPKNLKYKISLAGLYLQKGREDDGRSLLQQVIKIDPKSEEAEFAKRRLEELEMQKKAAEKPKQK